MKLFNSTNLLVAALLALTTACLADTVYLHDGRVIHGKVVSAPDALTVEVDTPFGLTQYRSNLVKRIEKDDTGTITRAPTSSTASPESTPGTQPAAAAGESEPKELGKADPAARQKYTDLRKAAEKAASGAEGLALWEQFLKDNPSGPLAEMARKEVATWKDRADKNQVRFGPQWQPKEEVDTRIAKADELTAKGDSAATPDEAAKLYDQAMQQHPYRTDIPMKKAMKFYAAKRMREFGAALGEVVRIDPNHLVARNSLGIVEAQQGQYSRAIMDMGRALACTDNDAVFDNFDLAAFMARKDPASAQLLVDADRQLRVAVKRVQASGKHLGEARWGNKWLAEPVIQKYMKENAEIDAKVAAANRSLQQLRATVSQSQQSLNSLGSQHYQAWWNGDITTMQRLSAQMTKARSDMISANAQIKAIESGMSGLDVNRNVPTHAAEFVFISDAGQSVGSAAPPVAPAAPAPATVEAMTPVQLANALAADVYSKDLSDPQRAEATQKLHNKMLRVRGEITYVGPATTSVLASGGKATDSVRLEVRQDLQPRVTLAGKPLANFRVYTVLPKEAADKVAGYKKGWSVDLEGKVRGIFIYNGDVNTLTIDLGDVKVSGARPPGPR